MSGGGFERRAAGATAAGAGAAALAAASAACCTPIVAPLVVALLGAGGAAWTAGLKPYSLAILGAAGIFLAYAYRAVYRPRPAADGAACPVDRRPLGPRLALWSATALWAGAAFLNLAPRLLAHLS